MKRKRLKFVLLLPMVGAVASTETMGVEPGTPIIVSVGCWVPEAVTQELLLKKMSQRIPMALEGPDIPATPGNCAVSCYDMDDDGDLDLFDWAEFEVWMNEEDPSERVYWID